MRKNIGYIGASPKDDLVLEGRAIIEAIEKSKDTPTTIISTPQQLDITQILDKEVYNIKPSKLESFIDATIPELYIENYFHLGMGNKFKGRVEMLSEVDINNGKQLYDEYILITEKKSKKSSQIRKLIKNIVEEY